MGRRRKKFFRAVPKPTNYFKDRFLPLLRLVAFGLAVLSFAHFRSASRVGEDARLPSLKRLSAKRPRPRVYFAGAVDVAHEYTERYRALIHHIDESHADVLTEHGTTVPSDTNQRVYEREMKWIEHADAVVAEVTHPSLGLGYELAMAESRGIPMLCLHRRVESSRAGGISPMLIGNRRASAPEVREYETDAQARALVDAFIATRLKGRAARAKGTDYSQRPRRPTNADGTASATQRNHLRSGAMR